MAIMLSEDELKQIAALIVDEMEERRKLLRKKGKVSKSALDTSPAVIAFPVIGQGSKVWNLTENMLKSFKEAFPGMDVMAEVRRAKLWCETNYGKRKTPKGMPKFLSAWLGRAQDRGGAHIQAIKDGCDICSQSSPGRKICRNCDKCSVCQQTFSTNYVKRRKDGTKTARCSGHYND